MKRTPFLIQHCRSTSCRQRSAEEALQMFAERFETVEDSDLAPRAPECWRLPAMVRIRSMSANDVEQTPVTAGERVLLRGLVDWVALDRIHWEVAQESPRAPLTLIQTEALD
ncbi:hypothetical protein [Mycolicibacterium pulveris]|uniref:hypothetical protein n=1 Tax=Mycolicibacterium pulveris TaxID=36813 RepID=UPI003CEAC5A8